MPVKCQYIFNRCPAKTVYALVIIPDNHDITPLGSKKRTKLKLCKVRVLILVNANVSELVRIILLYIIVFAQEYDRLHDNIVKIHGV